VLDAEAPTRVLKMLVQLWQACGLLGLSHEEAWAVVRRVAFDSVPKLRRAVLDHLAQSARLYTTTEVAEAVERPTQTTRRALEDLAAHRVIYREAGGPGKADLWALAKQTRTWLKRVAATFPVLSGGVEPDRTDVSNDADSPTGSTVPDKTGKVSVDEPAPPKGKGTRPANGRF
jgi:hypothetical protein